MSYLVSLSRAAAWPRLAACLTHLRGACIAALALLLASPAIAEKGKLAERLTPEVMAVVFPGGADRLGPEEGMPPAIAVYKGDKVAAYVFSTLDIIAAPGYSTTPFDVIAGIDLSGRITGAKAVFHNEPYILHDVRRQRLLDTFLAREAGRPLRGATNILPPDFVAGASVSSRAMRAAISITAALVLRPRIARPPAAVAAAPGAAVPSAAAGVAAPVAAAAAPALDVDSFTRKSWESLVAAGAVTRRRVTMGDVAAALSEAGAPDAKLDVPLGRPNDLYIDFAAALFTPAAIGGNLVGMVNFEDFKRRMPDEAQSIFVASAGRYDFKGNKFFRDDEGHRFDRLRVVQDGKSFGFTQGDYQWVNAYREGIKGMDDAAVFTVPASAGFDPAKPWRLEILVHGKATKPVTVAFGLDYTVPDLQVLTSRDDTPAQLATPIQPVVPQFAAVEGKNGEAQKPAELEPPLALEDLDALNDAAVPPWVEAWHDKRVNVAILAALLTALTLIFIFQATDVALSPGAPAGAHRLPAGGAGVARLDRRRAALHRQCDQLHPGAVARLRYRLLPGRTADVHDRGLYSGLAHSARPRRVLRLAVPVRRLAGAAGARSRARSACRNGIRRRRWRSACGWANTSPLPRCWCWCVRSIDGSGATTEIEPFKTAIMSKFTRAWPYVFYAGILLGDRAVLRAGLLPLPVSARRLSGDPRPAAPHRPAQAPSRMRQSVPSVRALLPGAGDRKMRQDHHRRMLPVPRLPSRIL